MKAEEYTRSRVIYYHALAKSRGIKFRRRDLRRLRGFHPQPGIEKPASFSDLLGCVYIYDYDLDDIGDLVILEPMKNAITNSNWLLAKIPKDNTWNPVVYVQDHASLLGVANRYLSTPPKVNK